MGPISLLICIPMLAFLVILVIPGKYSQFNKYISLVLTAIQGLIFGAWALPAYLKAARKEETTFFLQEKVDWIQLNLGGWGRLDIDYAVGVDGLNILLVGLSVFVFIIAIGASWKIADRPKLYFALLMLLNAATVGTFVSLDLFLFYICFEFMLLPMFFLIAIWGGKKREFAAMKFFLYTLLGSLFLLVVIVGLSFSFIDPGETAKVLATETGDRIGVLEVQDLLSEGLIRKENIVHSLNIENMMATNLDQSWFVNVIPDSIFGPDGTVLGANARLVAFVLVFLAFAIKLPAVPFHSWLPDAHVQAPTAISVVLAGVLLKVGGYGVFRFAYGLFPEGGVFFSNGVAILGMVSIVYGALVAMGQKDLKSLIAYSSISHMGFVLLGFASLNPTGVNGAVVQMINHGIISGGLFILVGVLYDRTGDRRIARYNGLWQKMPGYSTLVLVTFFAALGLPGLSGFIGEFLTLMGAFMAGKSQVISGEEIQPLISSYIVFIAVTGILFSAGYFLWTFRRMFFGAFSYNGQTEYELKDLSKREYVLMIPLIVLMILFGVLPSLLISPGDNSIAQLVEHILISGTKMIP